MLIIVVFCMSMFMSCLAPKQATYGSLARLIDRPSMSTVCPKLGSSIETPCPVWYLLLFNQFCFQQRWQELFSLFGGVGNALEIQYHLECAVHGNFGPTEGVWVVIALIPILLTCGQNVWFRITHSIVMNDILSSTINRSTDISIELLPGNKLSDFEYANYVPILNDSVQAVQHSVTYWDKRVWLWCAVCTEQMQGNYTLLWASGKDL